MFSDFLRNISINFNAVNHSKLGSGLELITCHQIFKKKQKKKKKERKKERKKINSQFYKISIKDHIALKSNELKITSRM